MDRASECCILVIEDEALVAMDLEAILRDAGCRIVGPVTSMADALRAIDEVKPDAAVLDLKLGNELALPVADALETARVPFIIITGHARDIVPDRHRHRPYLAKPYTSDALLAVLGATLRDAPACASLFKSA